MYSCQLIRQSWLVLSQQIVHMSVPLCWSSEVWFSQLKTEYYNKSGWTEVKWAKVKQVESRWGQRDFPIIDFGDPLRSVIIVHSQETGSTLWLACYQNGRSDLPMYCRSAFYFRASVFHRALNCGILPPALARGSEGWLVGWGGVKADTLLVVLRTNIYPTLVWRIAFVHQLRVILMRVFIRRGTAIMRRKLYPQMWRNVTKISICR